MLNTWHANRGLDGVLGSAAAGTITAVPPMNNFPRGWFGRGSCTSDSPSGYHPGLILVAMGDASVRSVALPVARSDSRTPGVTNWQAAVTPAGKELLGEDW